MLTLQDIRRLVARRLGKFSLITTGVQANPPDGSYVGVPTGADARRTLVSTDEAHMDSSGTDTDSPVDIYDGAAAYRPDNQEQRFVITNGFSGNVDASAVTDQAASDERVATWMLQRPYAAAIPAGTEIEFHHVLPPLGTRDGMGLHDCINEALMKLPVKKRITLTGTGRNKADLSAYTWLTREDQLIQVYNTVDDEDAADPDPLSGGGSLRFDGNTPYLLTNTPVSTGVSFSMDVWRPLGSWIYTQGDWADSVVGLVFEDDAVVIDPRIIVPCALYYCYEALSNSSRSLPVVANWSAKASFQASIVARWLTLDTTLNPPRPRHGTRGTAGTIMTGAGPVAARRGGGGWP